MDDATKARRMLAWFEAQLPDHELENWHISAQPVPPAISLEGEDIYATGVQAEGFRVQGRVQCERCRNYFQLPKIGNAVASSEDSIPRVVEKMKEWVIRDAGRCWGDVPDVPGGRDDPSFIPVLDSV